MRCSPMPMPHMSCSRPNLHLEEGGIRHRLQHTPTAVHQLWPSAVYMNNPERVLQVYTIVTTAIDGSSPQGRTAVVELLERLQEPVQFLQELFQPISSRVSQVILMQQPVAVTLELYKAADTALLVLLATQLPATW